MSKRSQKVLASATVLSLVMSTVAMAAPTKGTAISGASRVDTAIAIAKQSYSKWTDSKVAVIANGADAHLVDALTVAPLAYQKQAPIFLTLGTTTLEDSVISALKAQGVTTVYVVGGTVTSAVDNQLKAAGVTAVTHLAGATRFETAKAINTELEKVAAPSAYAVVNTNDSVADALSIAAEAAKQNIEIVLAADANSVPVDLTGKKVYAVGGTGVLSDALVTKLNATRLAGANRFATNAAVLQGLDASLDYTTTYVADGTDAHLVDSLPGSVLAAQTGSPIVLVNDTVAPEVTSVLTGKVDKMTTVTPLGGAVSATAVAGVVNPTTPTGTLAVSSVTATAANSISVKFNQAVTDTSKVAITVSRSSSPVAVTTTWSDDKTTATVASSSNFPEATYSVAVKNDTTDLGSNDVVFTTQRVAKIAIDSNTLSVITGGKTGYVGYHVYDQYGADITDDYLASDSYIGWTCGIGNVTSDNKGLLTITPYSDSTVLTQYQSAVINAVTKNQSIPASTSATLTVSSAVGTISDITLNKLTSDTNATPTVGDTNKYYIDFTAKDMSGNVTDNYKLIKAGLILQGADSDELITSNSDLVTAKLVQSPSDDTKAAVEVTIGAPSYDMVIDQPVTITVTTYTGKTSSLNFTVNRSAKVQNMSIMAPTENIAAGETKEIPFVAYDQNGAAVTKLSDLKDNVTLSPKSNSDSESGLFWDEDANGNAVLKYRSRQTVTTGQTAQVTLTSTVALSGKTSTVTLNIGAPVIVNAFKVDDSVVIPNMEIGASQTMDFGWNDGGFTVKDQYDRDIDLTKDNEVNGKYYFVQATTTATSVMKIASDKAYNGHEVELEGIAAGSANVKFVLMQSDNADLSDATPTSYSKTVSFTVLDDKDIKGYTLDAQSAPQYAAGITTAQQKDWNFDPTVYGKTSSGAKVVINDANIKIRSVSSSDFAVAADGTGTKVYAATLDATKTSATGTLTVGVKNNYDNKVYTATTTVTSSTDAPVAKSMGYYAYVCDDSDDATPTGITTDGNTITVNMNGTQDQNNDGTWEPILNVIDGKSVTRFNAAGDTSTRGYIYLYAVDQYGKKSMNLAGVSVIDYRGAELSNAAVDASGVLTLGGATKATINAGDYIVLQGVSTNGLTETVKIVFTK